MPGLRSPRAILSCKSISPSNTASGRGGHPGIPTSEGMVVELGDGESGVAPLEHPGRGGSVHFSHSSAPFFQQYTSASASVATKPNMVSKPAAPSERNWMAHG